MYSGALVNVLAGGNVALHRLESWRDPFYANLADFDEDYAKKSGDTLYLYTITFPADLGAGGERLGSFWSPPGPPPVIEGYTDTNPQSCIVTELGYAITRKRDLQADRAPWTSAELAAATANVTMGTLVATTEELDLKFQWENPGAGYVQYEWSPAAGKSVWGKTVNTESNEGSLGVTLAGIKRAANGDESHHVLAGGWSFTQATQNTTREMDMTLWARTYLNQRTNYDYYQVVPTLDGGFGEPEYIGERPIEQMLRLARVTVQDARQWEIVEGEKPYAYGTVRMTRIRYSGLSVGAIKYGFNLASWSLNARSRVPYGRVPRSQG